MPPSGCARASSKSYETDPATAPLAHNAKARVPRPVQSVADLMRAWRAAAGLSRAEAGARLNLAPGTIRDIEQGLSRVDDVLAREGLKKMIDDENRG